MSDPRESRTAYVVTSGEYSDYTVEAVFSSRDLAQRFIAVASQTQTGWITRDNFGIEEFTIDMPEEDWTFITVSMSRDGAATIRSTNVGRFDLNSESVYFDGGASDEEILHARLSKEKCVLVSHVRTNSPERAIKVTNERRAMIIAADAWGWGNEEKAMRACGFEPRKPEETDLF